MKDLGKGEIRFIESFIEPYRDTLEDVLTSRDIHSTAEQQAWRDWAIDEIIFRLSFDKGKATEIITGLETFYKNKTKSDD